MRIPLETIDQMASAAEAAWSPSHARGKAPWGLAGQSPLEEAGLAKDDGPTAADFQFLLAPAPAATRPAKAKLGRMGAATRPETTRTCATSGQDTTRPEPARPDGASAVKNDGLKDSSVEAANTSASVAKPASLRSRWQFSLLAIMLLTTLSSVSFAAMRPCLPVLRAMFEPKPPEIKPRFVPPACKSELPAPPVRPSMRRTADYCPGCGMG